MERKEWLAWRKKGIGGSDAPIIMGDSPYKTALQLFEEKITPQTFDGSQVEDNGNFATRMGNEAEPKIRSLFELRQGESFEPALVQSATVEWLRVSLDGRSEDKKRLVEFKLINEQDWQRVKGGVMVNQYRAQVQHALAVTGAEKCYFAVYKFAAYKADPNNLTLENLAVIEILPDLDYISELMKKEAAFWECVEKRKPPVPGVKDYSQLTGDRISRLCLRYEAMSNELEVAQRRFDEAKKEMMDVAQAHGPRTILNGKYRVRQESRQGTVDYSKIPELKRVDLDKYRKAGSTYWKMEVVK